MIQLLMLNLVLYNYIITFCFIKHWWSLADYIDEKKLTELNVN